MFPSDGAAFEGSRLRTALGGIKSLTRMTTSSRLGLDLEFQCGVGIVTLIAPPDLSVISGPESEATVHAMFEIQRAYKLPLKMIDDGGSLELDLDAYESAAAVLREMARD